MVLTSFRVNSYRKPRSGRRIRCRSVPTLIQCTAMQFKLFTTLFIFCCIAQQAVADDKELAKLVEKAEKQSNLIAEGSPPFHAKLRAADTKYLHPEFNAEIGLWWA